MKKFALLLSVALAAFVVAVPAALAGAGGLGNVNVTSDTACTGTLVGADNQISAGEPINVWVSGSVNTEDTLTWTLTSGNDFTDDGSLTYVCTDENTGFELWTTGLTGGDLSSNLGPGNKSSESYTLSVFDQTTDSNVGGDGFRRV
jgi:hypothetical protein